MRVRGEEPYRVYFARGKNLIVLKEGHLENEEEVCVLVNAANKFICHKAGVAGAIRERAGPKFQEESYKLAQCRKNPIKTGDVILQKVGGPNGKPILHAIGCERGRRTDLEENLAAMITLDGMIADVLSDASLTQRAKRAILAQKDLTNKAVLERIIKKGVGDEVFDEY